MKEASLISVRATVEEPVSAVLRGYLIEMAALMQTLPSESFELGRKAFKGALAELERVEELENKFIETQVSKGNC